MKTVEDIDLRELVEAETGQRFNREGAILCPFHNEKTPSFRVKFNSNKNKHFFKCFGCEKCGDAIDFIKELKGIGYKEARQYLGIEEEKTEKEKELDRIHGYIDWELDNWRKGQKLLGVFQFTNVDGQVAYYKAKFKLEDGKKQLAYYHIEGNKVIPKRGIEEVPYNLYRAIQGIKEGKTLIVLEGEKDVNTVNSMLKKDYVATSFKGCKDIDILLNNTMGIKALIISDTGEAGEKYKWNVYKLITKHCNSLKFVNLKGIKDLGDNKDVTDWLEAGHSKKDLLESFNRSLDLKNKYELQQDRNGIYKTIIKEKSEETIEYKKYISDFTLLEAVRITFVDEEQEGVKLILKSPTGKTVEKTGPSTIFDDTKTFKNFLGTIDLSFKGRIDDLTELKGWINRYFAIDNQEIYEGVKFIRKDDKLNFVTDQGTLSSSGKDINIKSSSKQCADGICEIEDITKDEMQELRKKLFKFADPEKSISIIGSVINNLAVYQNKEIKSNLHHLLIVGESGSGKSTILKNVVAPLLNYNKKDIRSVGLITPFALIKDLSTGNYPSLFDEFKPSSLDRYKVAKLSEIFRNLYDRATVSRADKFYKTRDFQFNRPLILAGEESYPNQEKALIERSCIVYLSKRERTQENSETMQWLMENETLLNKLGKSLIEVVLKLDIELYQTIRERVKAQIKGLQNRPLNTAINVCTGIEILNILMQQLGLKEFTGYTEHVVNNIKKEVLDGGQETRSTVEQMLILFNDMIENGRVLGADSIVVSRSDGLFIRTSAMIDLIHEHVKRFDSDIVPLKLKDFKKQAERSGYLLGSSTKVIKVDCYNNGSRTPVRFNRYDEKLVKALQLNSLVPDLFEEVSMSRKEEKVIFQNFNI